MNYGRRRSRFVCHQIQLIGSQLGLHELGGDGLFWIYLPSIHLHQDSRNKTWALNLSFNVTCFLHCAQDYNLHPNLPPPFFQIQISSTINTSKLNLQTILPSSRRCQHMAHIKYRQTKMGSLKPTDSFVLGIEDPRAVTRYLRIGLITWL